MYRYLDGFKLELNARQKQQLRVIIILHICSMRRSAIAGTDENIAMTMNGGVLPI